MPAARERHVRWLAGRAVRAMLTSDAERTGVGEVFRDTLYQWHLASGWAGKGAVLGPRLISPANMKMLRLPDRWFALYYVAEPFLWLRRRVGLTLKR